MLIDDSSVDWRLKCQLATQVSIDNLCVNWQLKNIPDDAILVTCDISALYTNIQRGDAVEAVKKILETRKDKTIPSDFIIELLDLVLKYNIFVFDDQLYQQLIGTAIGTKCAPNVADIFMSFIDQKIKNIAMKFSENGINPLLLYKRYLDDILFIFLGSNDKLHKFFDEINTIAPSIKFTM